MKKELNPAIAIGVVLVLVVGVVLFFMKGTAGTAPGAGRRQLDLNADSIKDPEAAKKSLQDSYNKYKESKGGN
jgi:hypothetical protein